MEPARAAERAVAITRLAVERVRAYLLRARGCTIGRGVLVGQGVRVDRPWAVRLGMRCQLEAAVWIKVVDDAARVTVDDYTFLGRGVEIDASASVSIGRHVLIAPGVFITDHGHGIRAQELIGSQGCVAAPVVVEDDVWLGSGCIILPGTRVGRGAVVGAGAVVTRDVPPNGIVTGVPASLRRYRE